MDTIRPTGRSIALRVIVVVLVIVGAIVVAWESGVKYQFQPKRWDTVVDGKLYRSGMISPRLWESTWRDHSVEVVVNLGRDEPGNPPHLAAQKAAAKLGIQREIYWLDGDGTGDPESYVKALKTIHASNLQGKTVHVHCSAGVYRTGAAIALYRVFLQGWTGRDATRDMIAHGTKNEFAHPLIPYLNDNMKYIADRLVQEGVIAAAPDPLPVFTSD